MGRAERSMVPDTEFISYYGKPILNGPVWRAPDIPGYLFLGGLAGASSLLAAGAQATGRNSTVAKTVAFGGISLSLVALVHDLGRPERFVNMLRVFKPSSPMNVGSWILAGYGPLAGAAAASALTGRLPRIGTLATAGAAVLGPAVAAYTAALVSDTAVPAWHDGFREMPYVFVGSAASAAGGVGMIAGDNGPSLRFAVLGAGLEQVMVRRMRRRMGMVAEPYRTSRYMKAAEVLTVAGAVGAVLGRRSGVLTRLSGAALVAGSALLRWGVFHAGKASAADPKYTVVPQRERLDRQQPNTTQG